MTEIARCGSMARRMPADMEAAIRIWCRSACPASLSNADIQAVSDVVDTYNSLALGGVLRDIIPTATVLERFIPALTGGAIKNELCFDAALPLILSLSVFPADDVSRANVAVVALLLASVLPNATVARQKLTSDNWLMAPSAADSAPGPPLTPTIDMEFDYGALSDE